MRSAQRPIKLPPPPPRHRHSVGHIGAATATLRGCAVTAASLQHSNVGALERRLLQPLELDERLPVVQHRAKLAVARLVHVPLRLHDEVVRGHADLELALLGLEPALRQILGHLRRLHRFAGIPQLNGRIGHLGGHLQLNQLDLRLDLIQLDARPRDRRFLRARAQRI